MPGGVPVAAVGIGKAGAKNAALPGDSDFKYFRQGS